MPDWHHHSAEPISGSSSSDEEEAGAAEERGNQDFGGINNLYWSIRDIPAMLEAHPNFRELQFEEQDRLVEAYMDEKFCEETYIEVLIDRDCYCYTMGPGGEEYAPPPPLRVPVQAAGAHVTYRDLRTALGELRYCNHCFLEELCHLGGIEYEAYFGS